MAGPPGVARITWEQALAWRMRRHLLDPIGSLSVPRVVGRLCGVQAQVASSADLAIRVRRTASRPGESGRAVSQGRLVKTWAMRGALHLLRPEDGGMFLSLIASGRSWERPSWQRYFGVTTRTLALLRGTAREALSGGPLTRDELVAAVTAQRGLGHVGEELASGWGTLLKPLAWQGDLCFGPSRGNRVTFVLPEDASARWAGIADPEEAAPVAVSAYLAAYGPATADAFGNWLAGSWFGTRRLRAWFEGIGGALAEVEVEGERMHVLERDLDDLVATRPTRAVRLLPGFDQFVLGPGTADGRVVPGARRAAVSRQGGWISPVVLVGGAVRGTWELDDAQVRIDWFREAGKPPRRALHEEVSRLAAIVGHPLDERIAVV